MPRISGSSDEIMMMALPSWASLHIKPVDLGLGADVDAAGGLVQDQDVGHRQQPAGDQHLLLVAARQQLDELVHAGRLDVEPALLAAAGFVDQARVEEAAARSSWAGWRSSCCRARAARP